VVTQITNYVTGDTAFAVDRSGVIVLWNPTAEKTLGYPASKALGKQCWKLLYGQDTYGNKYCNERCPLREMAFQHESVNGFEVSFKTASARRKKFSISCLVMVDEPGHELLLHICHDQYETLGHNNNHVVIASSANNHCGTLTRRETEVLTLLENGKSTSEIASMMSISTPTVRNHIQHILNKMQVHNRLEAVMLGKRFDLIQ
jgi:DNA-binding CsgD family transcriptional regulator